MTMQLSNELQRSAGVRQHFIRIKTDTFQYIVFDFINKTVYRIERETEWDLEAQRAFAQMFECEVEEIPQQLFDEDAHTEIEYLEVRPDTLLYYANTLLDGKEPYRGFWFLHAVDRQWIDKECEVVFEEEGA